MKKLQFCDILDLKELGNNTYQATKSKFDYEIRTFGGQIASLAVFAAYKTVPVGFLVNSAHSYFIRAGVDHLPTDYHVSLVKDGRSFCSRTVIAKQNEKVIYTLQISFHNVDAEPESPLEYQPPMPPVKHHTLLRTTYECLESLRPVKRKGMLNMAEVSELAVYQLKPVNPESFFRLAASKDHSLWTWIRMRGNLGDDQNIHRCAATYFTDSYLMWCAVSSQPLAELSILVGLDHTIWFHQAFRMDDWLLFEGGSIQMHGTRALCQARLWTEDGKMVATVVQEGLIRPKL